MTKDDQITKLENRIRKMEEKLQDESLTPRQRRKLEKELKSNQKTLKSAKKWMKRGNWLKEKGDKLQSTGKKMTRAGLHVGGATWTPVIYAGYRVIKKNRDNSKTPEQELIDLVKECEQAYKEGKISEEQLKHYIADYVNEHYRK